MSVSIFKCSDCNSECTFEGVGPFPPNQEASFGVTWVCTACKKRNLDVCNIGPLVPLPTSCLNCGEDYEGQEQCQGCGLTLTESEAFLRIPKTVDNSFTVMAVRSFRQGLFQRGLALLNRLLQIDIRNVEAWVLKYRFYEDMHFSTGIQKMCEDALANGAPPNLWFRVATVFAQNGVDPLAVSAYQQYLLTFRDEPKFRAIALSEQGNALTRLNNYAAAENAHQNAIAAMPSFALLYLNYADMLIKERKFEDALGVLDKGLSYAYLSDEKSSLLEAKAHVLAAQLRGEEALSCINEAFAQGASSVKTYYIRGQALAMLGRLKEARQAIAKALTLDPANADAQRAMRMIDDELSR